MTSSTRLVPSARLGFFARLASLLSLRLAAGAAWAIVGCVACDNDAEPGHAGNVDAGSWSDEAGESSGALKFTFAPMYSAFVEGHPAQLPVKLTDRTLRSKGAKFRSSDPAIASVVETDQGATITPHKAGVVAIEAAFEGDFVRAKLTISKFTEAQWLVGQARYAKRELAIVPSAGEAITLVAFLEPSGRNANGACTTCHGAEANVIHIEATPAQTAGYSDEQLITIFTMGKKPEGWVQRSMIPAFVWGMFHTWTVTEDEKQGLVAYLRTLTPKEQPPEISIDRAPCIGADAAAGPMLCDTDGRPVRIPGINRGIDAGAAPMTGEAGAADTRDAGAPDAPADAG